MRDMELAKAVSYVADVLEWDEENEWLLQYDILRMLNTEIINCCRDLDGELNLDYAMGAFSCVAYNKDFAVKFFVRDYHNEDDGCARYIEDIINGDIVPSEYQPMILDAFLVGGMMVVIMPRYHAIGDGEGGLCDDCGEYYAYETLVASWYEDDDGYQGCTDVHEHNLMWCHHTNHEIITDPFSWT